MTEQRDFHNPPMVGTMNEKQIEAIAMIAFRGVFARRLQPDDEFEGVWERVKGEEIFRTKLTLMAARAVARDGVEAA
jgi:hypothetical protein